MRALLGAPGLGQPALCASRCAVGPWRPKAVRSRAGLALLEAPGGLELPQLIELQLDGLLVLLSPIVLGSLAIALLISVGREPFAPAAPSSRTDPARRRLERRISETRTSQALSSLYRIGVPALVAALAGFVYFDELSLYLSSNLDKTTLKVIGTRPRPNPDRVTVTQPHP